MRVSRLPHAPAESYWASNIVFGVGFGFSSFLHGVARGVGGIVIDPVLESK